VHDVHSRALTDGSNSRGVVTKHQQREANFDGAARGQLCDRNVRDDFTQPSNSPDHGIKPVWRAINGAVPLAAEGHHFALELIEPAAMQDTLLFI